MLKILTNIYTVGFAVCHQHNANPKVVENSRKAKFENKLVELKFIGHLAQCLFSSLLPRFIFLCL